MSTYKLSQKMLTSTMTQRNYIKTCICVHNIICFHSLTHTHTHTHTTTHTPHHTHAATQPARTHNENRWPINSSVLGEPPLINAVCQGASLNTSVWRGETEREREGDRERERGRERERETERRREGDREGWQT